MARKKLPKGWAEGSVRDLLDLSEDEAAVVEMRVRLAEKVREKRRGRRVTQNELARRIQSTQPRIARLEQADASVSEYMRELVRQAKVEKDLEGRLLAALHSADLGRVDPEFFEGLKARAKKVARGGK